MSLVITPVLQKGTKADMVRFLIKILWAENRETQLGSELGFYHFQAVLFK